MNDDVDAAKPIANSVDYDRAALGGGKVRRNEQVSGRRLIRPRASGRQNRRACRAHSRRHRCTDPLGAAGDERSLPDEFGFRGNVHLCASAMIFLRCVTYQSRCMTP